MIPDYKDPQFIVTALTAIAANVVAILVYRGILNAEEANIWLDLFKTVLVLVVPLATVWLGARYLNVTTEQRLRGVR